MFRFSRCVLPAALAVALNAGSALSDPLPAEWQSQRDRGNALSDRACAGESAAINQVWRELDAGNPVIMNNMPWFLENCDTFGSVSLAEATRYQKRAAEMGYPIAMMGHGVRLIEDEVDNIPQDPERGIAMLEASIAAGFGDAARYLAEQYAEGEFLPRDVEKSQEYLRQAEAEDVADTKLARVRGKIIQAQADLTFEAEEAERRPIAALAVSMVDGAFGFAHDQPSEDAAGERALAECESRDGRDCRLKLLGAGRGCMAYHSAGGSATAHGWAIGPTEVSVQDRAARECRERNDGQSCGNTAWVCNARTGGNQQVILDAPLPVPPGPGQCGVRLIQFCENWTGARYDSSGRLWDHTVVEAHPSVRFTLPDCSSDFDGGSLNLVKDGSDWKFPSRARLLPDAERALARRMIEEFREQVMDEYPQCISRGTRIIIRPYYLDVKQMPSSYYKDAWGVTHTFKLYYELMEE
ncbi:DUF4189 domain-containing protein [Phaeobacter sp. 22II1-1F12B]|uniref:DUF4189 domain-containing protein n=1 Tax=Phaeobacter sp. 22II1-1F12B TaxID=1317111 RepID=UPI000B526104|nr:DUF4189 domain-containing protein [Phaeobacter sp. 22II1-1F12B]OWU82408.1 hypothetical protein ATO1_00270 [Phaeobacter sp. 22II1-1F12B]